MEADQYDWEPCREMMEIEIVPASGKDVREVFVEMALPLVIQEVITDGLAKDIAK